MTDDTAPTGQKDRSPSYPNIPLQTALDRLVAFEAHFKRSPARPEKVGEAWDIKAKAYADRTLAALRYFGLIDYTGTGKGRSATVSAEGRKYLRAQQESTKQEAIRAAALRPKQIAKFWSAWGADRPADDACLDELIISNGFSEGGAREFLKIYDSTIRFAGLATADTHKDPPNGASDDPQPIGVGDLVQIEVDGVLQLEEPQKVRSVKEHDGVDWVFVEKSETGFELSNAVLIAPAESKTQNRTPPILPIEREHAPAGWGEETLIDDSGDEIKILYRGKASLDRYEFIRDYLDFKINRLKKD